jgi:hypothetical protein
VLEAAQCLGFVLKPAQGLAGGQAGLDDL